MEWPVLTPGDRVELHLSLGSGAHPTVEQGSKGTVVSSFPADIVGTVRVIWDDSNYARPEWSYRLRKLSLLERIAEAAQ